MRLDRLISVYIARPIPPFFGATQAQRLPILMYHSISAEPETAVPAYFGTCTSPEVFASHLALLKAEDYQVMNLRAGLQDFATQTSAPRKIAILTFDDGFRNFYTTAYPLLQQYGFSATIFLPTAFIADFPCQFQGRDCLTWSEARTLLQAGFEIGSHTNTHPILQKLDHAQLRQELSLSKQIIEDKLEQAINSFAYPFAFPSAHQGFVSSFENLLEESGYDYGVTTRIGSVRSSDSLYTLKRIPINNNDDNVFFRTKLAGDYDWMALPQAFIKQLKRIIKSPTRTRKGTKVPP